MNLKADLFVIKSNAEALASGKVLIAEPFLSDSHFKRSVVLLLEHTADGSTGIILNKPGKGMLNDVIDELRDVPTPLPIYKGGPINRDTLFYLHTLPHIHGAIKVRGGLYINGDFDQIKQYILAGGEVEGKIRFFVGCAGWESDELQQEVDDENTWFVANGEAEVMMDTDRADDMWEYAMSKLGQKYKLWSRFPIIPTLN